MLLAGGQGSRLGVLTADVAKPAVAFGGKYRIIDFPLSNCINSGIDTVGVLTQYQPLRLNTHIGIGIPWEINNPVLAAEGHGRFCHFGGQHTQPASLTASKQHSNHFFLNHVITSCFCIHILHRFTYIT